MTRPAPFTRPHHDPFARSAVAWVVTPLLMRGGVADFDLLPALYDLLVLAAYREGYRR